MNRTRVFAEPKSMTIDRMLIKIRDRLTGYLDGYH